MSETNEERLERIKNGLITGGDIPFIIEGFERAQKFEERLVERGTYTKRLKVRLENMKELAEVRLLKNRRMKKEHYHATKDIKAENERLKKALYVAFLHAVESQSDGTIDVITDTLQGLGFMDIWDTDCEKGEKLFEEWVK